MRALAFVAAMLVVAGCGSSKRATVADCLNHAGFLVAQSGNRVEGTSPGGLGLTLTVYGTRGAARSAAARLPRATTAVVDAAVLDLKGNPGGRATLPHDELAAVRMCVARS